jgi:hypothetical protein
MGERGVPDIEVEDREERRECEPARDRRSADGTGIGVLRCARFWLRQSSAAMKSSRYSSGLIGVSFNERVNMSNNKIREVRKERERKGKGKHKNIP